MAYLSIKQMTVAVTKSLQNSRRNLGYGAALNKFKKHRDELMESFDKHKVTEEIEEAENSGGSPESAPNLSGLLDGKGNLFTFLGFPVNKKPIEELREFLKDSIKLDPKGKIRPQNDGILFIFEVLTPSSSELDEKTLMDWEGGGGWVRGIERGVSGFSNYMYWKKFSTDISRSTGGIQVENTLRAGSMSTTPYLLKMLERFKKEIEQ